MLLVASCLHKFKMIKLVSCHHIKKRRRRRTLRWHRRWRRHWQARRCGGRRRCRQPPLMTSTTCEIRRPRRTRTTPRNVQIKWDNYLLNSRKGPTRETEKQDKIPKTNKTQLRRKRHLSVWPFTLLFMVLLGDSLHYLAQNETPAGGQARPQSSLGVGLAAANSDANRLYEDLMMTYNRIVRPVQNESDRVVVRLGLKLSQLMDVVSILCLWSGPRVSERRAKMSALTSVNCHVCVCLRLGDTQAAVVFINFDIEREGGPRRGACKCFISARVAATTTTTLKGHSHT